ncbi:SMI1/KNR4 family protein [Gimesia chilikensis]|nr:SMI1/KNR4 family protein [Gimesia chilikensis]
MRNAIQDLMKLVPPSTGKTRFSYEDQLNVEYGDPVLLPRDYIDFLNQYSVGAFTEDGYPSWDILDLISDGGTSFSMEYIALAREKCAEEPEINPAVYPTLPGLLPWGAYNQGCTFYWWVAGDPDTWEVVADRGDQAFHVQLSMTEFLLKLFSDQLHELYPQGFMSDLDIGYMPRYEG